MLCHELERALVLQHINAVYFQSLNKRMDTGNQPQRAPCQGPAVVETEKDPATVRITSRKGLTGWFEMQENAVSGILLFRCLSSCYMRLEAC